MSAILKNPLLKLRTMQEDDIDRVLAIESSCYGYPWSKGIFQDCLRVGYPAWLMELDGQAIGFGVMSIAAGEAHILNICVLPEYQGRGVGRKILTRLVSLAKSHAVEKVFLEVRDSNRVAQLLYESEGFEVIGQRRGYYPSENGREDARVFAKQIG